MRRLVFLLLAACAALLPRSAGADSWVDTVFPERAFDFGTVARGSKVHHSFKLVNRTSDEIHIAAWRTKCGCTEVRVGAREVPPGTQTVIEAVIDTTKFQGYKASGLTLVLDRPTFAEIDLNLTCFIRGDLMLAPGQVDFGVVQRASAPPVTLNLIYSGGIPNWGIVRMQTQSTHLTSKLQELGRTPEGATQYQLIAQLKPTVANGYFKDEITLYTNDPSSPMIPISVSATVQTAVSLSPTILNLGRVRPGEVIKKTVLVRSSQPFKLTDVKPSKSELSAQPDPEGARPLHVVNLTFKAPPTAGPYNAVCEISTDLKDEPPARLTTFATVAP